MFCTQCWIKLNSFQPLPLKNSLRTCMNYTYWIVRLHNFIEMVMILMKINTKEPGTASNQFCGMMVMRIKTNWFVWICCQFWFWHVLNFFVPPWVSQETMIITKYVFWTQYIVWQVTIIRFESVIIKQTIISDNFVEIYMNTLYNKNQHCLPPLKYNVFRARKICSCYPVFSELYEFT